MSGDRILPVGMLGCYMLNSPNMHIPTSVYHRNFTMRSVATCNTLIINNAVQQYLLITEIILCDNIIYTWKYLVQFHPSYENPLMHFAAGVHLEYEHVRLHM